MKKTLPYIISIVAAIIVNMLLVTFDFSACVMIIVDIPVCVLVGFILKMHIEDKENVRHN